MFKFTVMTLAPTAVLGAGLSAPAAEEETKYNPDEIVSQMTGDNKCATYSEDNYARTFEYVNDDGTPRTVILVSQEGEPCEVEANVAALSKFAKNMIPDQDDWEPETEIPLPNVKTEILTKVIEFLEHYQKQEMTQIEKPLKSSNMHEVMPADEAWFADFVADDKCDQETLFELILAANFMDIKPLLDLTCAKVASMIKGKTPDQIKDTFGVDGPTATTENTAEPGSGNTAYTNGTN